MESIIRNTVRSILLETRANLAIRPIMKKWWEVAGQHGVDATRRLEADLTMHEYVRTPRRNFSVGLIVPKEHKHKVFDGLTKDAQEWVLKHWKTREYFGNMISGVILGVVDSYGPDSKAIGQKYGRTSIAEGTWDSKTKTWVGGMEGYLTIKSDRKPYHIIDGRSSKLWQNPAQRTSVRSDLWTRYGLADLKKSDSILFHEFQHWFQESVMYTDKRMMVPTPGSRSGLSYTRPTGHAPEKYDPPARYIMHAMKQYGDGVDWDNPIRHPNANCMMYEITDNQLMLDTLYGGYAADPEEIWYMSCWVRSPNCNKDEVIDYIENTLKLPLSEEGKEMVKNDWHEFTRHHWHDEDRDTVGEFNSGRRPSVEYQKKAFARLSQGVIVRVVSPSHFRKKKGVIQLNRMKPDAFPSKPTTASIKTAKYIVFMKHKGYGRYSNFDTLGGTSQSWRQFQRTKTTISDPSEWEEYWHEFDAESRNYMAMVTMDLFREDAVFHKNAILSNEEELADKIWAGTVRHLNRGQRISGKIMSLQSIRAELKNMADRIADRIIEIVEEYDPYWYKENHATDPAVIANPNRYGPIIVDIERVKTDFIDGQGFWRMSMWGGYWNFIHDKVIGEI